MAKYKRRTKFVYEEGDLVLVSSSKKEPQADKPQGDDKKKPTEQS